MSVSWKGIPFQSNPSYASRMRYQLSRPVVSLTLPCKNGMPKPRPTRPSPDSVCTFKTNTPNKSSGTGRQREQGNGRKILGCRGSSHGHRRGGKCASSIERGTDEKHDGHVRETHLLHANNCHARRRPTTQNTPSTPQRVPPLQEEACKSRQVLGTRRQQGSKAGELEVHQKRLTVSGG